MNAEFKAKWVEALRSGKYRQTQQALREKNAYCCLGVACDISGFGVWDDDRFLHEEGNNTGYLPTGLRERMGLEQLQESSLITMNDDEGKTFAEIADYIEANL